MMYTTKSILCRRLPRLRQAENQVSSACRVRTEKGITLLEGVHEAILENSSTRCGSGVTKQPVATLEKGCSTTLTWRHLDILIAGMGWKNDSEVCVRTAKRRATKSSEVSVHQGTCCVDTGDFTDLTDNLSFVESNDGDEPSIGGQDEPNEEETSLEAGGEIEGTHANFLGEATLEVEEIQALEDPQPNLEIQEQAEMPNQEIQAQVDELPDQENQGEVNLRGRPIVDGNKIYYEYNSESGGAWECGQCPEAFPDVKKLESHYRGTHLDCVVKFNCSKCGRNFVANGILIHYRKWCKGRPIRVDPDRNPHQCSECDYSAASKRGLSQHERHRHPELRNLKRIAQRGEDARRKRTARKLIRPPGRGGKLWSAEEDDILERLCIVHQGTRLINMAIAGTGLLPGKTNLHIGERRRQWKEMKAKQVEEGLSEAMANISLEPPVLPTQRCLTELETYLEDVKGIAVKSDIGTTLWACLNDHVNGQALQSEQIDEITKKIVIELGKANPRAKRTGKTNRKKGKKANNGATEFSRIQRLFATRRKVLVKELLDGKRDADCPLDVKVVEQTYQGRFGGESKIVNLQGFPAPESLADNSELLRPINRLEVRQALGGMKNDSATGPDGVKVLPVKNLENRTGTISLILNAWLYSGIVPKGTKANRSILLPKTEEGLEDVGNWRPLTISSVVLRCYTKILAKRLLKALPLNERQKGFRQLPGCSENVTLVNEVISMAKQDSKELAIVFLDLAKAFDTVSHDHLVKSLKRFGVDMKFIDIVVQLYAEASTSFTVGLKMTDIILMLCGVKQGDPLSPILFLACMDPLMCSLETRGAGLLLAHGVTVTTMAYADDTAVVAGSKAGMEKNLELVKEFCLETGLKLNVKKSVGFHLRPIGKSYTVNEGSQFECGGEAFPWVMPGSVTKYLGAKFDPWRGIPVVDPCKKLEGWAQRIHRAPLKPRQKVSLLSDYACARLMYHMSTATPSRGRLDNLDSIVRYWVKRWLKLSDSTNTHFFYTGWKEGGLGISKFAASVPHMIVGKFEAVLRSKDPVLVTLSGIRNLRQRVDKIKEKYHVCGLKTDTQKASWREEESKSWAKLISQGKGVECMAGNPQSNTWINGESFMTESEYIAALQLRTNTYPTRECTNRGRAGANIMCRRCGLAVETIGHISGWCLEVKDNRIARHNRIVYKVKAMAEKKGFRTLLEPKVKVDGRTLVPDLIIYDGASQKAIVIDPTVVWDDSGTALDDAARRKVEKYTCIIPAVKTLTGCKEVRIQALVMGCRGSWHGGNDGLVQPLGWKRHDIKNLCLLTLCGTLKLIRYFMDK